MKYMHVCIIYNSNHIYKSYKQKQGKNTHHLRRRTVIPSYRQVSPCRRAPGTRRRSAPAWALEDQLRVEMGRKTTSSNKNIYIYVYRYICIYI